MNVRPLPIDGALELEVRAYEDDRGYFKEVYNADRYAQTGANGPWLQDNLSFSRRGVLRGLHGDARMSKLVQVVCGEVFDVIADIRPGSPTYGRWFGTHLREEEHRQIFVPAGVLHGFLTLTPTAFFLYKQSAPYDPGSEFGVAWNDPQLAVAWPLEGTPPLLSPKDAANPTLAQLRSR